MCRGVLVVLTLVVGIFGLVLRTAVLHGRYLERVTAELSTAADSLPTVRLPSIPLPNLRLVIADDASPHSRYVYPSSPCS